MAGTHPVGGRDPFDDDADDHDLIDPDSGKLSLARPAQIRN